jgi:hypothetical protein
MGTPDPGQSRHGRRRRQPAAAPSRRTAAPPISSPEPRLVPLLDLLADLIARHIVATAGDRGHPEMLGSAASAPAGTPAAQAEPSGPSPTVPADSQEPSHPSPTKPRRRTRRRTLITKEAPHASD